MIEKVIRDYLIGKGFSAYLEKPKNAPQEYILLEKTGSGLLDHINTATIAVQSYAGSKYKAADLNEEVKIAMLSIIETEDISKCSLNSDYDYTDTSTKEYRYQAVFDLVY